MLFMLFSLGATLLPLLYVISFVNCIYVFALRSLAVSVICLMAILPAHK